MTDANICDRCGEAYRVTFGKKFLDPRKRNHPPSDLCPECHGKLKDWWDAGEDGYEGGEVCR